jgi:hypothetical protein
MAAGSVLVASNAFVLVHAAMNRRGSPEAELALTWRELRYNYSSDGTATLTLVWQNPGELFQARPAGWYDERKLRETGFDLSVPPNSKEAGRRYQNSKSREVFVALEFDGPEWQKWLEENREQLRVQSQNVPRTPLEMSQIEAQWEHTASRLVAVDAALDPEALRRKYPDRTRVMILRGLAQVFLQTAAQPYLRGRISQILSQTISVPTQFREFLPSGAYEVALRSGRLYEPWIADMRVIH